LIVVFSLPQSTQREEIAKHAKQLIDLFFATFAQTLALFAVEIFI